VRTRAIPLASFPPANATSGKTPVVEGDQDVVPLAHADEQGVDLLVLDGKPSV
jgi:hypothetical protein